MSDTAMRYDKDHYTLALMRMKSNPATLTPADLAQLEIIDPAHAAEARAARLAALKPEPSGAKGETTAPAADENRPATIGQVHRLIMAAVEGLVSELGQRSKATKPRVTTMSSALRRSNSARCRKWVGIWDAQKSYREGNLATHGCGLWLRWKTPRIAQAKVRRPGV